MADPMTPAEWRSALRAEGVPFTELDGWTTRGRDEATGKVFGPVHGSLNHHTAGRDSLQAIAYKGQSAALPPPLAHTYLPKSGRLVLVADGRANHAGLAARNSFDAIKAETAIPKPSKASGTVDGNDHLYGIEVENLGDGRDTYTRAQYDTWVRYNAAICRHHRWKAGSCAGHLETSVEGKVDPRGPVEGYGRRGKFAFTMKQLRADVEERLAHPASWSPAQASTPAGHPDGARVPQPRPGARLPARAGPVGRGGVHRGVERRARPPPRHQRGVRRGPGPLHRLPVPAAGEPAGRRRRPGPHVGVEGATLKTLHPIHEVIGTPGAAFAVVPLVKRLGAGRSMRVRLLNQSAGGIEVASAVLTALVWKES